MAMPPMGRLIPDVIGRQMHSIPICPSSQSAFFQKKNPFFHPEKMEERKCSAGHVPGKEVKN